MTHCVLYGMLFVMLIGFLFLNTQTVVDSIMLPGVNTNCEEDVEKFLVSLQVLRKDEVQVALPNEPTPTTYDNIVGSLPNHVRDIISFSSFPTILTEFAQSSLPDCNNNLSDEERSIIAYIAGYIVRKICDKCCQKCQTSITHQLTDESADFSFIQQKMYEQHGQLKFPSALLVKVISDFELAYRKCIDEVIYSNNVKAVMVSTLLKVESLKALGCQEKSCQVIPSVAHLFVNIRLHHSIKEANVSLSCNKQRSNRKVIKFSHKWVMCYYSFTLSFTLNCVIVFLLYTCMSSLWLEGYLMASVFTCMSFDVYQNMAKHSEILTRLSLDVSDNKLLLVFLPATRFSLKPWFFKGHVYVLCLESVSFCCFDKLTVCT